MRWMILSGAANIYFITGYHRQCGKKHRWSVRNYVLFGTAERRTRWSFHLSFLRARNAADRYQSFITAKPDWICPFIIKRLDVVQVNTAWPRNQI